MITRPSLMSFLMWFRELALPISACSAGSSQILRLPTPATEAARRFCERRLTMSEGVVRLEEWWKVGGVAWSDCTVFASAAGCSWVAMGPCQGGA